MLIGLQKTRLLYALVLVIGAYTSSLFAEENIAFGPRSQQVRIRHVGPKGLGYKQGYSSLDLFPTVSSSQGAMLYFLDLRGHLFNNGTWAANGGVGCRYLSQTLERVFGFNAFYDFRRNRRKSFQQIAAGIEALGKRWDVRANGYMIIEGKKSSPYHFEFDLDTFQLTARREYGMSGADAEVGYHFPLKQTFDLYAAAGPYYYTSGQLGKSTVGGRLRAVFTLFTYATFEGIVSYDHLFRWIGQGAVALNFPFGARRLHSCDKLSLQQRLYQPVQHNEIIVVKNQRKEL